MAANYAKFYRVPVGSLNAGFQQFPLVQNFWIFEIFTILLWNINNLKSVKNSKKIFSNKIYPKTQLTIEIT